MLSCLTIICCNGLFQLHVCSCHLPLLLRDDCGNPWILESSDQKSDVWQGLDVDDLAELYNTEMTNILNRQLPTRTSSVNLARLIRGSMQSVELLSVQLDVWNVPLPPRVKTRWLLLPPQRHGAHTA